MLGVVSRIIRFFIRNAKSFVFLTLGFVFLYLGVLGVIFPVLPGLPFLVLSLTFFAKSSSALAKFLVRLPFGKLLTKRIPARFKVMAILSFWVFVALPPCIVAFLTDVEFKYEICAFSFIPALIFTVIVITTRSVVELPSSSKD